MNWLKSTIGKIIVGGILAGAVQALAILPGHAGENLDAIKAAGVLQDRHRRHLRPLHLP